jgi:hypothetical protein
MSVCTEQTLKVVTRKRWLCICPWLLSKKFAGKCFNCGKNGHRAGDCHLKTKTGDGEAKPQELKKTGGQDWMKKAKCYNCQGNGHISNESPEKSKKQRQPTLWHI